MFVLYNGTKIFNIVRSFAFKEALLRAKTNEKASKVISKAKNV